AHRSAHAVPRVGRAAADGAHGGDRLGALHGLPGHVLARAGRAWVRLYAGVPGGGARAGFGHWRGGSSAGRTDRCRARRWRRVDDAKVVPTVVAEWLGEAFRGH